MTKKDPMHVRTTKMYKCMYAKIKYYRSNTLQVNILKIDSHYRIKEAIYNPQLNE